MIKIMKQIILKMKKIWIINGENKFFLEMEKIIFENGENKCEGGDIKFLPPTIIKYDDKNNESNNEINNFESGEINKFENRNKIF